MEKGSGESGIDLLWPTLLSLAVAVSGYLTFAPQFESQRPKSESEQASATKDVKAPARELAPKYPSRLWEDPLGDAYQRMLDGPQERTAKGIPKGTFGKIAGEPRILVITVPPGKKADDCEFRLRTRYAVHAALGAAGYRPDGDETLRVVRVTVPRDNDSAKPELIPFEQYRDDWAWRMYGVEETAEVRYNNIFVFWLPVDATNRQSLRMIGALQRLVRRALEEQPDVDSAKATKPELPKPEEKTPGNRKKENDPVQVIGPYNSDLLLAMTQELMVIRKNPKLWQVEFGKIQLYPWRATLELTALKNVSTDDTESASNSRTPATDGSDPVWPVAEAIHLLQGLSTLPARDEKVWKSASCGGNLPVRVTRVIGTDWHLAQRMREELRLRNAWPDDESSGFPWGKKGFVVLITEKDTLYGNTIPLLYNSMLPSAKVPSTGESRGTLIVYRYLQGLDGNSPLQEVHATKKGESVDPRQVEHAQGCDPQGSYQIDYLKRLADDIEQRDREIRDLGCGRILAIGIMGSDVYDKLLVLRALRKRFPNVWFFTHDLNDDYCRPSEMDYTQNLLVASHFGLTLHPALQRDAPPFRDSYQTSAFLCTLAAVGDARTKELIDWRQGNAKANVRCFWPRQRRELKPGSLEEERDDAMSLLEVPPTYDTVQHLAPLVFEIGRQGPYQLTYTGPKPVPPVYFPNDRPEAFSFQASVQPPGTRELRQWTTGKAAIALFGLLLVIAVLAIQITAVREFLESAFCVPWRRTGLDGGDRQRAIAMAWIVWTAFGIVSVVFILMVWNHFSADGQPFTFADGISAWPGIILRVVAVLATAVFAYLTLQNLDDGWSEVLAALKPTGSEMLANAYCRRQSVWSWVKCALRSLWTGLPKRDYRLADLVATYEDQIKWPQRLFRSAVTAIAYAYLGYVALTITDSYPNALTRGLFASWASFIVTMAAGIALCFITFLVVDIERFGAQFVREMGRMTVKTLPELDSGEVAAFARQVVRAIAKHTHDINKLIWYPFIVMLLLVIARQRIFSGDNYPVMLAIVQFLLLLILYFHSFFRLRTEANSARIGILRQLKQTSLPVNSAEIAEATQEIDNEQEGAFGHWTQDYFLKALALPFLGETGFLILQKWMSGG